MSEDQVVHICNSINEGEELFEFCSGYDRVALTDAHIKALLDGKCLGIEVCNEYVLWIKKEQ